VKKTVVFLVIAAMMLCFAGTAFAATFSDTGDLSKDAQASIAKLNSLEVINGYPDGTFKPANTITRAEFAKIAIILGGLGQSADVLKDSTTKFSDVAANQWYTGYINLAASQGYVKGFPDGTFRPNAKISYAQVVTVLLRVLGYNDNLPGAWPVDYIAKAGALDITEKVSLNANAEAPRSDVAIMADATLDATVVKWNNDTESFDEQKDSDDNEISLLDKNFSTAVNEDYIVTDTKYDDGVWSIKVTATDDEDEALDEKWIDLSQDCVISDGSLPTGLDNAMVDILYNDDDEEVLYLEITSTTATVDGEDWEYNDTKDQFTIDDTKYDQASYFDGYVYGEKDATDYNSDAVYRAFISDDDEVYLVSKRNADTPAIVDEYDADANQLIVKEEGNYGAYADIEDIDFGSDSVLIEKGGKFIEPKDLAENDVIYVSEDSYGYDYYIEVAGGITQEGTLDGFEAGDPAQIEISGEWYDVADISLLSTDGGDEFDGQLNDSDLSDSYDATLKYVLNKSNQVCIAISSADGSEGSTVYGVVTEVTDTNASGKITKIKVMKKDGTEASYAVDTSDVEVYYAVGATTNHGGTYAGKELDEDDFIKFSVNEDNEIDSLTILAYDNGGTGDFTDPSAEGSDNVIDDYSDSDSADYIGTITGGDDDNNKITFKKAGGSAVSYKVNDNTIIFNAAPASDDDGAEIVSLSDLLDWAADTTVGTKYAYVQYDGSTVDYIFIHSDVSNSTDVSYAAILKSYTKSGDKWVKIDAKGTAASYEVNGSQAPEAGSIYDYSITGNKFKAKTNGEIFDPQDTVSATTYDKVTAIDKSELTITLDDGTNVMLDADTVIYDYSDWYKDGSDPEYCKSISSISKNDKIWYALDNDGNADLIVIVNNIK